MSVKPVQNPPSGSQNIQIRIGPERPISVNDFTALFNSFENWNKALHDLLPDFNKGTKRESFSFSAILSGDETKYTLRLYRTSKAAVFTGQTNYKNIFIHFDYDPLKKEFYFLRSSKPQVTENVSSLILLAKLLKFDSSSDIEKGFFINLINEGLWKGLVRFREGWVNRLNYDSLISLVNDENIKKLWAVKRKLDPSLPESPTPLYVSLHKKLDGGNYGIQVTHNRIDIRGEWNLKNIFVLEYSLAAGRYVLKTTGDFTPETFERNPTFKKAFALTVPASAREALAAITAANEFAGSASIAATADTSKFMFTGDKEAIVNELKNSETLLTFINEKRSSLGFPSLEKNEPFSILAYPYSSRPDYFKHVYLFLTPYEVAQSPYNSMQSLFSLNITWLKDEEKYAATEAKNRLGVYLASALYGLNISSPSEAVFFRTTLGEVICKGSIQAQLAKLEELETFLENGGIHHLLNIRKAIDSRHVKKEDRIDWDNMDEFYLGAVTNFGTIASPGSTLHGLRLYTPQEKASLPLHNNRIFHSFKRMNGKLNYTPHIFGKKK